MYKELVQNYIVGIIQLTGAKVDPFTGQIISMAMSRMQEHTAQSIYEYTKSMIAEFEASNSHHKQPVQVQKSELRLEL